jgi:signal transduction histidine kinase
MSAAADPPFAAAPPRPLFAAVGWALAVADPLFAAAPPQPLFAAVGWALAVADPLFAAAGWGLAAAALSAAVLVRRGQDRRLALVAEAAHELRGPLCAARLGLHALETAAEPVARRAAAVELELRRAGLALEDLQAAPRGRRTGERFEVLDAGGLLAGAAAGWSTIARSHGARLRIERPGAPALVRADRLRLAQALGNLVANAAEHGGAEVRVRAAVERGRVRIEVADDGPGLPASVAALVAARRTAHGPRGHGLAIALRIAGRHGGRLLTAPTACGARLVLDLPLASPTPPGRSPARWPRRFRRATRASSAAVASPSLGAATPPSLDVVTSPSLGAADPPSFDAAPSADPRPFR